MARGGTNYFGVIFVIIPPRRKCLEQTKPTQHNTTQNKTKQKWKTSEHIYGALILNPK